MNGHGNRTKDDGSRAPMAQLPRRDKGAAPKTALLFPGKILVGNVGGRIAAKSECPTVSHEPAGDVLSIHGARPEMALVNIGPCKAADPRTALSVGLEVFSCVDPAVPVLSGSVDTGL